MMMSVVILCCAAAILVVVVQCAPPPSVVPLLPDPITMQFTGSWGNAINGTGMMRLMP